MLTITLKNNSIYTYKENEYTDYFYDGKILAVIKDKQWIAIFTIDSLRSMTFDE